MPVHPGLIVIWDVLKLIKTITVSKREDRLIVIWDVLKPTIVSHDGADSPRLIVIWDVLKLRLYKEANK